MVYVDGSLRNDWISALAGTNHSSILYPSIGASAILTNMFTMKSNILSYAKVRLSYSEVGNAPERFRAITTYAVLEVNRLGMVSNTPPKLSSLNPNPINWHLKMLSDSMCHDRNIY